MIVDIDAIPRTNICLGETVDLLAKTNLTTPIPTVCGLNADRTCGSGSDSINTTIGAGTVVNGFNSSAPELFGDFGEAQSRSQIIILASELQATGFVGGKITSMAIDIARLETGKSHTIPNVSIKMACTGLNNFGNSFVSGLDEVFTVKSVTFTATGLYNFVFDKAFDWDGQTNVVIEICSYTANGTGAGTANWGNFTRDNVPGFAAWRQVTSPNSNGGCTPTGTEKNFNQRPNIRFNICRPKVVSLTYSWTPTNAALSSTTTARPTSSTTVNQRYYVRVTKTDQPTCFGIDSVDITVEDPSLFTPTTNATICEGDTLKLFANTTGVTYFWSGPNGFSSSDVNPFIPNITRAAAGTYTFLIDKGFCKATKTIDIRIDSLPFTGTGKDSSVCRSTQTVNLFGLLTGEDPGGTWLDDNASGILAGGNINPSLLPNVGLPKTFNFTYRISNTCGIYSTTVKVTVIGTKSAGVDDDTLICETSNAINLFGILDGTPNTGGTWADDNSTGQMSPAGILTPANLGGGTYKFTYTVAGTAPCPNSSAKVTVVVSDQPTAGLDAAGGVCTGSNVNLFSLITGSPKTGGIFSEITASGGTLTASNGDYTATGVTPGVYRFRYVVGAATPCLPDTAIVTLTVRGVPAISNVISTCSPTNTTYSVTFNITGGDPASYSVSPSGTITGTNPKVFTSNNIPDATTVVFTVSDQYSCGTSSTTVLKRCACPTQAGTVQTSPALQVCNTNSATVIYKGGYASDGNDTLGYVLHTSPNTTLGSVIALQSNPTFAYTNGIVYGQTYYISAIAGTKLPNGLVDLNDLCLNVSVGVPIVFGNVTLPSFSFSQNPACPGASLTMTSSVTGTPTYQWTGPNNFSSSQPNPTINNLQEAAAGDYTLTINSNGCVLSTSRSLTIVSKPIITITGDAQVCQGQCGNIYITVTAPAPVLVTYNASPGTSVQVSLNPGLNTIQVCPTTTTTYTLQFANYPGGCGYPLTGSKVVQVIPTPVATFSVVGDNAFCYSESDTGKVAFQLPIGLTADLVYSVNGVIQPTATNIVNGSQILVPAKNPGATVFKPESLKLTTGSCVVQNNNPPITFYNLIDPIVNTSVDKTTLCEGDSVKVTFKVVSSQVVQIDYNVGGVAKSVVTDHDTSVYEVINNTTFILAQRASYLIKPSCNRLMNDKFDIIAKPVPVINFTVQKSSCNNVNNGAIVVTSQNPNDLFSLNNDPYTGNGTFSNLFSGFYTLKVIAPNGCLVEREIEVVALSNLTLNTDILETSCGFDNGSVSFSVDNGKPPYNILFNGAPNTTGQASNLKAGTYQIIVIDSNNCVQQDQIVIGASTPVSISLKDNGLIDCDAPEYSQVIVSAKGGTGVYTYSTEGVPEQTDSILRGLWPQTYTITVKDTRGCVTTKQIKLNSKQKFTIAPMIRKPLLCFESKDAEVVINITNSTSGAVYSFDNINYQSNNFYTGVGPGNFLIYVRETEGCHREQSAAFTITRPNPIELVVQGSGQPTCFNTFDGFIKMKAIGGSLEAKEFTINGGQDWQFSGEFVGILKGDYTLIARNEDGCSSDTVKFNLPGPPDIVVSNSFTFNAQKSKATLTVDASGGTPGYMYSLNGDQYQSSNVYSNINPGDAIVRVRDRELCVATSFVRLTATGIEDTEFAKALNVYPNPFSDAFMITSENGITDVTVRVLNTIGQVVLEQKFREIGTTPVVVQTGSGLAPGIYNLEISSPQGNLVRKLDKH